MLPAPRLSRRKCLSLLAVTPLVGACARGPIGNGAQGASQPGAQVALLLPLSGARAGLGQQMAKAVWLVEDFGGTPGMTRVLDSGETTQSAAQAARDAMAQGANIIVGPLFRDQTPAVVQAAGPVPVLSLSNDTALAASGAWVFGVTPAQSVNTVLRFAKDTGAQSLAVVETGGTLGQQASLAVQSRARTAKVKPLPNIPAATQPKDMADALRQSGGGAMPDIVYVPGTGANALRQAEAAVKTGVTTIGSLQWSGLGQEDLERLDKACFTGPDPVRFDRMSSFFRAQLDEELGVIAALAVDAVGMAHSLDGAANPNRRTAFEGLLGNTRFDRNKTCERDLAILRIDGGNVLPVA
ncbi:penicillin-binding protein activator [uncultured Tateyamaria sp.]|uniref:penicillin-binding protein activator n=1 Tax=uncultured Tateyamaria sp. TaxID=455651 RepID=UPI002633B9F7|nr:penicillin-binding protein activator [uncultured Tateyamaria sp.]